MKQVMEILFENRSSPVGQSAEKAMYLHGTRGQQQAALRQILKEYIHQKPDATPIVLQAERVTDFFITAVSAGMTGEYRAVLSRCALLVITDLEFIQGRTQVAEFILEILEYRKRRNLPTLLTGTCPPEALLNHTGHNGALPCRSIPLPLNEDFISPSKRAEPAAIPDGSGAQCVADISFWAVLKLSQNGRAIPLQGEFFLEKTRACFLPTGACEEDAPFIISADPRYAKGLIWLAERRIPLQLEGVFSEGLFYISALTLAGKPSENLFDSPSSHRDVPLELEDIDPEAYTYFQDEAAALKQLQTDPDGLMRLIRYLDRVDSPQAYRMLFSHYGPRLDPDTKEHMLARVLTRYGRIP